MKKGIHPTYFPNAKITCACGTVFEVGTTNEGYSIEVCSKCHPFYTGKQKLVDAAGRVDKFLARQKMSETRKAEMESRKAKKEAQKHESLEEKVTRKAHENEEKKEAAKKAAEKPVKKAAAPKKEAVKKEAPKKAAPKKK